MAEKTPRSNTKTATTLMAYAQLEVDNSSTCIPRLCKFNIARVLLNRLIDGGDSNAIVVAVKIQSNKRTFRCCEIPLQQDGTLDAPVNLQYMITYPHYFKRDINKIQIYVQRRKNRPLIGYKTLASGEINLNQVIQHPTNLDLQLYSTAKPSTRQDEMPNQENQKRSVGSVSINSLSSTIPDESNGDLTTNSLMAKRNQSFNEDDEYLEEEELNSELEDSDFEFSKMKQKFNRNLFRNKFIQMFKRKNVSATKSNSSKTSTHNRLGHHQAHLERQSDIEEEDPPSDISDDTIPVDQWSIESVPKPGFAPVEHLQTLHFNDDDRHPTKQFDSTESPIESDATDGGFEVASQPTNRENAIKQCDDLYSNDHLPESIIFLYTGLNQSHITPAKFQEYNLSVISINSLNETKLLLNNIIQRMPKYTSPSVIRLVLLGDDAFVNSFLQSYVECLASKPHEYMSYFRFYFIPLVFSCLAKFLGSFDSQYETLFGHLDSSNETLDVKDLTQKITKYLKTAQRTLSLSVGEVMLNRKGKLPEEDSSPTFLPFFCYVRLGTLSSNENQFCSIDDNALLSASLSLSIPTRENKDSSDDENSQAFLLSHSPQSKVVPTNLLKSSHLDESFSSAGDVAVDYWTIIETQKEKRTIKSSLKSNIRILTITRQPTINSEGKIASSLKMTFVTREKKLKMMKFGKKMKDLQNSKYLEPQAITGINRLVCTSKSQNVDLKVNVDGQEWDNVKFFQISSQWHTHIKYFPIAIFNEIRA